MAFMSTQPAGRSLFESVVNHASDGIVVLDFDGYVILCNPAATELFQRHEEDLRGEPFGYPVVVGEAAEIDIRRDDGSLGIAEMRVSHGYWERERVFVALLRDITERKRMEEALRRSQEELTALYRCAPLGMVALEPDLSIRLWNRAAETILGWREADALGRRFTDLSDPLRQHLHALEQLIVNQGNVILGKEFRHVRRDGGTVDVSISLAPITNDAGSTQGLVCLVEDISRRIRDAEHLRLAAKIFENAQEGVVVTDASGVILDVNQAFFAVTGYSRDEALGRKPSLLKSGRHDDAFYDTMWRTLKAQGQWSGEVWNRRKNGEVYPEWLNISAVVDDAGEISHYVALFSDISKVKETEDRLRRLAHFDA